jgi:hypothetical protein
MLSARQSRLTCHPYQIRSSELCQTQQGEPKLPLRPIRAFETDARVLGTQHRLQKSVAVCVVIAVDDDVNAEADRNERENADD